MRPAGLLQWAGPGSSLQGSGTSLAPRALLRSPSIGLVPLGVALPLTVTPGGKGRCYAEAQGSECGLGR